jgi:hypothetical protein
MIRAAPPAEYISNVHQESENRYNFFNHCGFPPICSYNPCPATMKTEIQILKQLTPRPVGKGNIMKCSAHIDQSQTLRDISIKKLQKTKGHSPYSIYFLLQHREIISRPELLV